MSKRKSAKGLGGDMELSRAVKEIRAVMRKHGVAGCVNVVGDSRAMYLWEFPPCVGIFTERDAQGDDVMRVRAKRAEFATEAEAHKFAEDTAAVVFGLRDLAAMQFDTMDRFAKVLKDRWDVEHKPFQDHRAEGGARDE